MVLKSLTVIRSRINANSILLYSLDHTWVVNDDAETEEDYMSYAYPIIKYEELLENADYILHPDDKSLQLDVRFTSIAKPKLNSNDSSSASEDEEQNDDKELDRKCSCSGAVSISTSMKDKCASKMNEMRLQQRFTDWKLVSKDGNEIHIHKIILAGPSSQPTCFYFTFCQFISC
jgi:hypothetical protein